MFYPSPVIADLAVQVNILLGETGGSQGIFSDRLFKTQGGLRVCSSTATQRDVLLFEFTTALFS